MSRGAILLVCGLVAAVVGACDTAPNLKIYNGVGRPLDLEISKHADEVQAAHLKPGEAARAWNIYGPTFRLRFDHCERLYDLPYMGWNEPWPKRDPAANLTGPDYSYPVRLQLAEDGALYLLPSGTNGVMALATIVPAQAHGYPLKPRSVTCR